jgi:S-DNA-T family DNA segregation ATPase FtsK/SpoIIIE
MKPIHPNMARIACVATLFFMSAQIGCRTPSGGVANPFLAPDRVPPPATRAIMPGQAQPYYPGDPLPVMQSSTAPQQASQNGNLAWGSRGTPTVATGTQPTSKALAAANEKIAIPTDNGDLRFAASQRAAPIQAASSQGAASVTPPSAAAAPDQSIVQAAFNGPGPNQLPTSAPNVNLIDSEVVSPWRPPQISQSVAAAPLAPSAPSAAIPGGEPNGVGVRLRPVPSPPPDPMESPAPRIRLPGYYATQPYYSNAALPPGRVIYSPPAMQTINSAPQPLQPGSLSLAGLPQGATGPDGFRPRTTMR